VELERNIWQNKISLQVLIKNIIKNN
jgi:hypothetical protein